LAGLVGLPGPGRPGRVKTLRGSVWCGRLAGGPGWVGGPGWLGCGPARPGWVGSAVVGRRAARWACEVSRLGGLGRPPRRLVGWHGRPRPNSARLGLARGVGVGGLGGRAGLLGRGGWAGLAGWLAWAGLGWAAAGARGWALAWSGGPGLGYLAGVLKASIWLIAAHSLPRPSIKSRFCAYANEPM